MIGMPRIGTAGEKSLLVEEKHTARHLGSGGVDVLATPAMVALMEETALGAVDPLLPAGWLTVGASLDIRHLAPTPLGMKVTARAELTAVDGRMLTFRVEAFDEKERIGEGTHVRAAVDLARFAARIQAKKGA
jgi:fluoroacetyl-CoA thioesterase